jgi:aryl-alcohol dehydrogenase-like predicted oxidoreductase
MEPQEQKKINRRKFIQNSSMGLIGAGIMATGDQSSGTRAAERPKISNYRILGRTGFRVSDIGCGGNIIDEHVIKAVIDSGVNYFDTSEAYMGGNSERIIGKCLTGLDRKKYFITTKIYSPRAMKSEDRVISSVRSSLERFGTEYVDCLMIHGASDTDIVKNEGFHSAVQQLKSEGRVRFCGVSCHGTHHNTSPRDPMESVLMTAVEDGRFDVLLLAYNYLESEPGSRIMKVCREKKIGTTIMKSDPATKHDMLREYVKEQKEAGIAVDPWLKESIEFYKKRTERAKPIFEKHNLSNLEDYRSFAIRYVLSNRDVNTLVVSFYNFSYVDACIPLSGRSLSSG